MGRERELHELAKAMRCGQTDATLEAQGHDVVTVVGTGGIGKTALASAFAARFGWRFPGGVIGVSLADLATLEPRTVFELLLERLGDVDVRSLADRPVEHLAEVLAAAGQVRRLLILIDNYESVLQSLPVASLPAAPEEAAGEEDGELRADPVAAEALHRLVARLADQGLMLLLTSRRQPAGLRTEYVFPPDEALEGLDRAAGVQLFFQNSARADRDRPAHADLAAQVWQVTEGHPLAIELLAGEFTESGERTPQSFLEHWDEELAAAYRPGLSRHHVTFQVAFDRSFRRLAPQQRRELAALSRFPAPFYAQGAALVWGDAPPEDEAGLAGQAARLHELVQRSLLKVAGRDGDGQPVVYRLEPVIQRTLRNRVTAADAAAVDAGYAAWFVDLAFGGTGRDPALAQLVLQWLDELTAQAAEQPAAEAPWYWWRLAYLARQFGRVDDAIALLAAGEEGARGASDEAALARLQTEQANVWLLRGDLERALQLYQESLVLREKLGDLQGKAASLHNMANLYIARQDWMRAKQLIQNSLEIAQELGAAADIAFGFGKLVPNR